MSRNLIFTIIAVALVLLAGGVWFFNSPSAAPSSNSAAPAVVSGQVTDSNAGVGDSLSLVDRLKQVKIDTSFFQDPVFSALEEAPAPSFEGIVKGRTNPFLPLKH